MTQSTQAVDAEIERRYGKIRTDATPILYAILAELVEARLCRQAEMTNYSLMLENQEQELRNLAPKELFQPMEATPPKPQKKPKAKK